MALSSLFGGEVYGPQQPGAGDFFDSILPVAKGIGGIIDMFNKKDPYKDIYKQAGEISPEERLAQSYFMALADPNNSLVKSLTEEQMRKNTEALLMQLRNMQNMDRRLMARGQRGTYFDPERRDETLNYLLTRGAPALRAQAEETARNNLNSSAKGLAGFADSGQDRLNTQFKLAQQRAVSGLSNSSGLSGQIGQIGTSIQDILKAINGEEKPVIYNSRFDPERNSVWG